MIMVDVSRDVRLKWHGKWIWIDNVHSRRKAFLHKRGEDDQQLAKGEKNVYCLLRRIFSVSDDLERATMNITVDSRYKLFINGKYVGRGLNRCEAYYWYYNTYDVKPYISKGKNVIAIHARFYGEDFAFYTGPGGKGRQKVNAGKGGLLFDLQLAYRGGKQEWIGSDDQTRVAPNEGESSDLPLKNDALGFIEEFDSRRVPKAWNEIEFDDTGWFKPVILDYPIKTILLDENHPLHEEIMPPSEIIVIGENDDVNREMDEEDKEEGLDFCVQHMLEGTIGPLKHFTVINQDNLMKGKFSCEIVPNAGSDGKVLSIFLKFPHEMVGYPQIVAEAPAGTIIDIIPTEKMANNLPKLDFILTKRGSRVVLRGGIQFFEQWDWEGYLYMLVKIRNLSGPMKLHRVVTNRTHMRVTKKGSFTCNVDGLNQLWESCALTVLCCAIDGYLDCPSREQRSYLGDAYPEALVANACFGEPRLTKKLIYDTAFGQRQDGMTYSFHPGDAVPQTHIIPDYCLYWIQLTRDYYQYYGDEQVLIDMYPHFLLALEWFWKYIDADTGLLVDLPYWTFIDWSFGHDKPGMWAILNTQFMDVLLFMGELAERFDDQRNMKKFKDKAASLRPTIDRIFWDARAGCYRDFFHEGKLHQQSYMTNAYLVLKDVTCDPEKIAAILKNVFEFTGSDAIVKSQIDDFYSKAMSHHAFGDKLKGLVVVSQPFFQHHVNKFFSKVGRHDLLLTFLYKWIPMLTIGKTKTVWETWSIDGSECHAWAATPAYDLSTYWLGVKPSSPGFKSVEISPTFHGLESVEGIFPTCKGDIKVCWKKDKHVVRVAITIPNDMSNGTFVIPTLDGRAVSEIRTTNSKLSSISYYLKVGSNEFTLIFLEA
jgi:alpha-L-rhamnosidase